MISTTDFFKALSLFVPEQPSMIEGITADSRTVTPQSIFFDFLGKKEYGEEAFSRGATYVVTPLSKEDFPPEHQEKIIQTTNPRLLFAKACSVFYPKMPEYLAAVTGTNGKSSTVDFLRQLWQSLGYSAVSIGTIGLQGAEHLSLSTSLTTPDPLSFSKTLQALKENEIDYAAFEASSHGLSQYRIDGARVKYAGFTNLTQDHLDYHGTMEDYFYAKARLFTEVLDPEGKAIVNADDAYGKQLVDILKARGLHVLTYSTRDQNADLFAKIKELSGRGMILSLCVFQEKEDVTIPVVGNFQVENILCALGIALASTPYSLKDFKKGLEALHAPKGRMDHVGSTQEGADIYVDYAHTPDALKRALSSLRAHTQGKLHVIFGCGGNRDITKRPIMGKIASDLADVVIITDDNPRHEEASSIRHIIAKASSKAMEIANRGIAITQGIKQLQKGDVLLIAGKGHEQGQIIGDEIIPFCDKLVAQKCLAS